VKTAELDWLAALSATSTGGELESLSFFGCSSPSPNADQFKHYVQQENVRSV
jgi:hypothetical protein